MTVSTKKGASGMVSFSVHFLPVRNQVVYFIYCFSYLLLCQEIKYIKSSNLIEGCFQKIENLSEKSMI